MQSYWGKDGKGVKVNYYVNGGKAAAYIVDQDINQVDSIQVDKLQVDKELII